MSFICLSVWLLISQRPVIELDELTIEGDVRRPQVIDLESSQLQEKIEKTALQNLIRLEEKLLKRDSLEGFLKSKNSAK